MDMDFRHGLLAAPRCDDITPRPRPRASPLAHGPRRGRGRGVRAPGRCQAVESPRGFPISLCPLPSGALGRFACEKRRSAERNQRERSAEQWAMGFWHLMDTPTTSTTDLPYSNSNWPSQWPASRPLCPTYLISDMTPTPDTCCALLQNRSALLDSCISICSHQQ
jgi:hypothetical protein